MIRKLTKEETDVSKVLFDMTNSILEETEAIKTANLGIAKELVTLKNDYKKLVAKKPDLKIGDRLNRRFKKIETQNDLQFKYILTENKELKARVANLEAHRVDEDDDLEDRCPELENTFPYSVHDLSDDADALASAGLGTDEDYNR